MVKHVLGLDIGIASVGWAIVNKDNGTIVDSGVRLFKEGSSEDNVTRRSRRGSRRIVRRRKQRLDDYVFLSKKYGLIESVEFKGNALDLRVKGLKEKLTNQELFEAMYQIVKNRGTSLETVEESAEDAGTKGILNENAKELKKGKFICEIQLERLQNQNRYRGHENTFKTKDYVNEVKEILSNQDVDEEFKQELIKLINRRRHFSEGPGSKKSPTEYGRYYYDKDGELIEIDLIEKMRGRCSVYPEELRAPKFAPSVELFNFLNDLNNLSFGEDKITTNQKQAIINNFILKDKHSISVKKLASFLEVDPILIKGAKTNEKDEPILSEFKGLKKILKALNEDRHEFYTSNFEVMDEFINIITKTKVVEERINQIKKLNYDFISDDEIEAIANIPGISGYHALSFKAIYELNQELMDTDENQMQILYRLNLVHNEIEKYKDLSSIPSNHELILNPVVQRSLNETIKVINAVRKQFGEMESIIIEMPRDKNSKEEKKRIEKANKIRKTSKEQIKEELQMEEIDTRRLVKLMLYKQQDGKCVYTGEPLIIQNIINDPTSYDIDHIIPVSISYDDSLNNKVLVTNLANRQKGNLTPFMAFDNNRFDRWSKEEYISYVNSLHKNNQINNKKKEYLLSDTDITRFSNMGKFIARNLVDTSYASRSVLNILQGYFKANEINTKVFTIRGALTSVIRNKVAIKKDRDNNYVHHAIDAASIALLSTNNQIDKLLRNLRFSKGEVVVEDAQGNPIVDYNEFFSEGFLVKFVQLRKLAESHIINEDNPYAYLDSSIKISHKVDKKPNRKLSDDTIYSTRTVNDKKLVVKKYKDIYDPKFLHLAKNIEEGKTDKYLMFHHDPQTFDKFVAIVRDYNNEFGSIKKENPFYVYYNNHGKVTKFAKKGNGPEITSVKYYDGELGSHIPLANHNSNAKDVVLLQVSPYRTDFYMNEEGKYKFVTIRFHQVHYSKRRNKYYINPKDYDVLLKEKGVNEEYKFQFSMHRNEYIAIEQKVRVDKGVYDVVKDIYRYVATNNDKTNVVEVKQIHYQGKRLMMTIGNNLFSIKKYHCDVLGKLYQVQHEDLKLEFDIGIM